MQPLGPDRTACSQSVRLNTSEIPEPKDYHSAKAIQDLRPHASRYINTGICILPEAVIQKALEFTTKSNMEAPSSSPSQDAASLLKELSQAQAENSVVSKVFSPAIHFAG